MHTTAENIAFYGSLIGPLALMFIISTCKLIADVRKARRANSEATLRPEYR